MMVTRAARSLTAERLLMNEVLHYSLSEHMLSNRTFSVIINIRLSLKRQLTDADNYFLNI